MAGCCGCRRRESTQPRPKESGGETEGREECGFSRLTLFALLSSSPRLPHSSVDRSRVFPVHLFVLVLSHGFLGGRPVDPVIWIGPGREIVFQVSVLVLGNHWKIPQARDLRKKISGFSLMEHIPVRLCKMGPLYPDCVSDTKTRFLKNSSQSFACVEVICPQPRRSVRVPYFMEDLSRFSPESKSILPRNRDKTGFEIIGVLLNKDDMEVVDNEIGYLCGSPPVRTHNPVIHDAHFTKQMNPISSPLANSSGGPNPAPRVDRGSPIRSGSPKIRVEGFTCGKSDPRCVVPTLA